MPERIQIIPYSLEAERFQRCMLQIKVLERSYPAHGHDHIEMELLFFGSGRQWVNNSEVPFHAGILFLLSPEDYHRVELYEAAQIATIHIQRDSIASFGLPVIHDAYAANLTERLFDRYRQAMEEIYRHKVPLLEYYEEETVSCCFVEYVVQRRLYHACSLLKATDKTVTDIAYELGFSGLTHFFRCFKKKFLYAPEAYRKRKKL